jgi:hypothetical protein
MSSLGLPIHGPLGLAPKGLQDSAQGFNPGNPQNKWFALKGREMRLRDKSRTHCGAKSQSAKLKPVTNWHWNPSTLLGRAIWRPFRARRSGWLVPRVETLG